MTTAILNRHLLAVCASILLFGIQPVIAGGPGNADSDSIQDTYWWVEDIAGAGVVDASHTTVAFMASGRVAGDTGCNRYTGNVTFAEERLEFGPLAGTRRACVPALMNQEDRFYQAMASVVSWRVAETGLLYLLDQAGEAVIRAAPIDQDQF